MSKKKVIPKYANIKVPGNTIPSIKNKNKSTTAADKK
jgi:hypothetical protein